MNDPTFELPTALELTEVLESRPNQKTPKEFPEVYAVAKRHFKDISFREMIHLQIGMELGLHIAENRRKKEQ